MRSPNATAETPRRGGRRGEMFFLPQIKSDEADWQIIGGIAVQSGPKKRFHRWVFNGLATVSPVLCLATVFFAIRSIFLSENVGFNPSNTFYGFYISSYSGVIGLQRIHVFEREFNHWLKPDKIEITDTELRWPIGFSYYRWKVEPPQGLWLWFHYKKIDWNEEIPSLLPGRRTVRPVNLGWQLTIPDWMILGLTAVLPWRWFVLAMRGRKRPGFCGKCGYDLRATPERCPECGAVP
jgi:hypothetical protein